MLCLLLVVILIIWEAIQRLINPENVLGYQMLFIAFIGLSVNIISIAILHGSHKDNMNIRGVFYHMISDAVSSIGIILAAVIILITGWSIIDPLVSLLISGLILYWAWGILKESSRVLLETAPKGLDIDIIRDDLNRQIVEVLLKNKSVNKAEIYKGLNITRENAYYRIKKLIELEIISLLAEDEKIISINLSKKNLIVEVVNNIVYNKRIIEKNKLISMKI